MLVTAYGTSDKVSYNLMASVKSTYLNYSPFLKLYIIANLCSHGFSKFRHWRLQLEIERLVN